MSCCMAAIMTLMALEPVGMERDAWVNAFNRYL